MSLKLHAIREIKNMAHILRELNMELKYEIIQDFSQKFQNYSISASISILFRMARNNIRKYYIKTDYYAIGRHVIQREKVSEDFKLRQR